MSVRRAALWSMSGQYLVFATQFIVSVIVSRFFLSPAEVGLFSIALSAAMLVSVFQDFGITRYVAGEPDLTDSQIRSCFSVSLIFAFAVGLVILGLAWPVARFYGDSRLFSLLLVVALSYLMVPFAIVPSAVLTRAMDFRSLFMVNVGAMLANATVALGFAAAGWSAMSLAWAAVAQQGARAAIAEWRSGWRPSFRLSLAGTRPILRFGGGTSLLYMSGAVGTRTPELIVGRLLGFAAVGLYGRAVSLAAQLRTLVSGAIGGVFYPAFARIRDTGGDLAAPYLRVVAGYSATTWPAMMFLAASAQPLVLMLYGPKWAGVAPLLTWIALSEMLFDALPLHIEMPILLGRMKTLLAFNIVDTIVSISLLLIGTIWSLEAAALSRIGYGLVWYGIYAAFMHRLVGFRWGAMLGVYARSALASFATAAPLLAIYAWWKGPAEIDFPTLAAAAAGGVLCWLAALFALRHPLRHELVGVLQSLRPTPA